MRVISRLWVVELIQIILPFDSQVRGISITVGIIYFIKKIYVMFYTDLLLIFYIPFFLFFFLFYKLILI